MKKLFVALALLAIFAPVALAEDGTNAEVVSVEAPALAAAEVPSETAQPTAEAKVLDSYGLPVSAVDVVTEKAAANYECPPFTTYCQRDNQCDAACGGPGTGACEFGCCYCAF